MFSFFPNGVAAPDVPEPFGTLEMIYEEMGDEDKRFQVSGQAFLVLPAGELGRVGRRVCVGSDGAVGSPHSTTCVTVHVHRA